MSGTLYGVLGVGPDADDGAIRAAYRERVKDHHPDVSSAPDATERFKRVTTAKETLLDPKERSRYDRLGHAAYVDTHGDPSLWQTGEGGTESTGQAHTPATESTGRSTEADSRSSGSGTGTGQTGPTDGRSQSRSDGSSSAHSGSRSGPRSATSTGSMSRTVTSGSSHAETSRESTRPGASTWKSSSTCGKRSGANDSAASNGQSVGSDTSSRSSASGGNTASDRSDATSGQRSRTASTAQKETRSVWQRSETGGTDSRTGANQRGQYTGGAGVSGRSGDGPFARTRRSGFGDGVSGDPASGRSRTDAAGGDYATGDFWDRSEVGARYRPRSKPPSHRFIDGLRTLGLWILVHALFLSLAVGTGWYVYSVVLPPAERSLSLFFVLIGEVGLAVVLSSLHILTRIYR